MNNSADLVHNKLHHIAGLVKDSNRFLLLTHTNPDGDALGSLLGLGQSLISMDKKVVMFHEGVAPEMFSFLPGMELISEKPGAPEDYDMVIMLDCHSLSRVGASVEEMKRVPIVSVLDHHVAENNVADTYLIDTSASAAGELVFKLLKELGVEISPGAAIDLYVAISTDTGSFSFENTSAQALEIAAELIRAGAAPWDIFKMLYMERSHQRMELLGTALAGMEYHYDGKVGSMVVTNEMMTNTNTTSADTDGFVEYPRSVKGVELAVLFRENGAESSKVSMRSLGRVDAAALARSFGGGGHFQAAGFSMDEPIHQVKEKVIKAISTYLPADGGGITDNG